MGLLQSDSGCVKEKMSDLKGRRALVAGGSRGLGRGSALSLAEAGADLAIIYRKDQASAAEVVAKIQAMGRRAIAVKGDVTDPADLELATQQAVEYLGGLDTLVVTTGQGNPWLSLADTPPDRWRKLLASNLDGIFYTTRLAMQIFIKQKKGSAVLFTSTGGLRGTPMQGPYAAAKAAVINLTATWAQEVAQHGIRVNAIAPGLFETDMTAALRGKPMPAHVPPIPAGRIGTPMEMGKIVTFLCSDAADYINGETIRVDGGWYA